MSLRLMSLILWGMVPGPHPHVVRAFTHHDPWPTHPYALDRGHAQATAESAERSLRVLAGQSVDEAGKNASRNMHSQLKSLGYSLPIDIHPVEHCSEAGEIQTITTYHIKPSSWIRHWMSESPEILGGCGGGDPGSNFEAFWKAYQVQHPEHVVFRNHMDHLDRVVPLLIHGDEGRAIKRTNYLLMSVESPLGTVHDPNIRCSCAKDLANRPNIPQYGCDGGMLDQKTIEIARGQLTNYKGHSYLSRWILFGVGGWIYKKRPEIVNVLLTEITNDLRDLFHTGVETTSGKVFFGAVIAIKGDMAFHKSLMRLDRSYHNLDTAGVTEICHHCLAGGPGFSFEDFSEDPMWVQSMYLQRPWPSDQPPPMAAIPYDPDCPEQILQGDIFHIHKVGVARDVIGGVLILLLRLRFLDYPGSTTNIVDRLQRAHSYFVMWARSQGKSPGLRSFTKSFFNLKTLISSPWANSKGSDSMLLLEWLIFTLKLNLQSPAVEGHSGLLKRMLQLCPASLSLKMIHSHKLWLERDCARQLYAHIMTTLRAYAVCARDAIALKVQAFRLKPKFHALHHIGVFLKSQLVRGNTLICNPQMYACEPNEDFVGRISRLSRKVNIRLCDKRVYERYFLKVVSLLRRRKRLQVKRKIGKTPNLWSQICDDFYSTWSWNLGAHVFPAALVATPCQWRTQRIIRISKRRCFRCWWGCH